MEFDFGGYVTRFDQKCSDGRIIKAKAFKHMDGIKVPLVWRHNYDSPDNVLGHAMLEYRDDGVYGYAKFNSTERGQLSKKLVEEKNLDKLSIYANGLVHEGADVVHGDIREVSLVISGANPGAVIDNVVLKHEDGYVTEIDDAAIITSGDVVEELSHEDSEEESVEHADENEDDETIEDVLESMTEKQYNTTMFLIEEALKTGKEPESRKDGDDGDDETEDQDEESEDNTEELKHSDEEGPQMKNNVFDGTKAGEKNTLTHDQQLAIFEDAKKNTKSLRESFLAHADTYGIKDIESLFPEAKNLRDTPDFVSRRMEWVGNVLNAVHKSPFSRIRSRAADITADDARARGYVKGNLKKEEVFSLLQRVTGPTTIYKKQKLDRDDIIDITDFDVVAWLRAEMRVMLDEEIARAILIGDGRGIMLPDGNPNPDKIDETKVRPIWKDEDFYAYHHMLSDGLTMADTSDEITRAMSEYRGSGSPTLYAPRTFVTDALLERDKLGRRLYDTKQALANALGVANIVEIDVMANQVREVEGEERELVGIIVNLRDYTIGADKGGKVGLFDDFDIDYNQYKYLIETRMSGTLTLPRSAIVIERPVGSSTTTTTTTSEDPLP